MFLLLACAALASAAVKPYAIADLGMSIPMFEGKTLNGSLHRVTGGIRFQFGAN